MPEKSLPATVPVMSEKMPYGVSMMIIMTISTTRVLSAFIHSVNSSACSGS